MATSQAANDVVEQESATAAGQVEDQPAGSGQTISLITYDPASHGLVTGGDQMLVYEVVTMPEGQQVPEGAQTATLVTQGGDLATLQNSTKSNLKECKNESVYDFPEPSRADDDGDDCDDEEDEYDEEDDEGEGDEDEEEEDEDDDSMEHAALISNANQINNNNNSSSNNNNESAEPSNNNLATREALTRVFRLFQAASRAHAILVTTF